MNTFRYHPEIEGLKINENGTEVFLNESSVPVRVKKNGNHPYRYIYFRGNIIGIARLVLECWQELPANPQMFAKHRDGNHTDYHYTNLVWETKKNGK